MTTSKRVFQQSPCSWATDTNKWSCSASRYVTLRRLIHKLRKQVIMNMIISVTPIPTILFSYQGCFWLYFIRDASYCTRDLISKTRPRVCSTMYCVIYNKEIHVSSRILRQLILKSVTLWSMLSGCPNSELDLQKLYCISWKQSRLCISVPYTECKIRDKTSLKTMQ